jgi:prepilin-type N-terminal cleavage/methylation domain-containing protein
MRPSSPDQRGFTLVEILVSTAILLGITLLAGRLLNDVAGATTHAGKLIDSDNQARLVFSRMAGDFAALHARPDLSSHFRSQGGNDQFYFFSQVPGHSVSGATTRTTGESLVGYRVGGSSPDLVEMERLALGLGWMEPSASAASSGKATALLHLPFLVKEAYADTIQSPYNNSSNPGGAGSSAWDVIGNQVFRLEYCFLLRDGKFSTTPAAASAGMTNNLGSNRAPGSSDDSGAGFKTGSRWYDLGSQVAYSCVSAQSGTAEWAPLGLEDVSAVVVTVALLPPKSRAILKGNALGRLGDEFPDFNGTETPGATWSAKARDVSALASATGVSAQVVSSVRVYERFFYLN